MKQRKLFCLHHGSQWIEKLFVLVMNWPSADTFGALGLSSSSTVKEMRVVKNKQKPKMGLLLFFISFPYVYRRVSKVFKAHTHTHTHTHIYIYIYICVCVCVCVCVERETGRLTEKLNCSYVSSLRVYIAEYQRFSKMLYFHKLLLNLEFHVEFKNRKKLIYCRKWVLNISPVTLLWFQPVIERKTGSG